MGKFFKLPLGFMSIYRNGKFMGRRPLWRINSTAPINVGKWTDTLHTRGHRTGFVSK